MTIQTTSNKSHIEEAKVSLPPQTPNTRQQFRDKLFSDVISRSNEQQKKKKSLIEKINISRLINKSNARDRPHPDTMKAKLLPVPGARYQNTQ